MLKFLRPKFIIGRILIFFFLGSRIKGGPFKGAQIIRNTHINLFYSKLLGIYEKELHYIIRPLLEIQFENIIIVGCAEGYYAAGFVKFANSTRIIGFEANQDLQNLCVRNVNLNNTSKLFSMKGICEIDDLNSHATEESLILMDCEGSERELLNPNKIPQLKGCEVVVECHDIFDEGITEIILERFSDTHIIKKINARVPNAKDLESLPSFLTNYLRHTIVGILSERPLGMHWLHMKPKQSNR